VDDELNVNVSERDKQRLGLTLEITNLQDSLKEKDEVIQKLESKMSMNRSKNLSKFTAGSRRMVNIRHLSNSADGSLVIRFFFFLVFNSTMITRSQK
jgi:hypothetical protein